MMKLHLQDKKGTIFYCLKTCYLCVFLQEEILDETDEYVNIHNK